MAAPTLALLNYTDIADAESTTGWTKFDLLDTDIKKEGANGITGTFRADATLGHFDNGSAPVTAVAKTFRMWINTTNVPYLDTLANGGCELLVYDGTTTEYVTVFSSEDYFGGWFQVVIDMDLLTTLTLANVQRWGIRMQLHTSAKNVDNVWVDALKYLDGYSILGGTSGDEVTLATIEVADRGTTTLYGYGIIGVVSGVYYCTGKIQLGTGATTMWFLADGEILIFEDKPIAAGLYELSGIGTGSRVTIRNSVLKSSGSTDATRFIIDMSDSGLLSCVFDGNLIVRASTVAFKSGQSVVGSTFDDCGVITSGEADFAGTIIKNHEGAANSSGFLWDLDTNPDTLTEGMTFIKGTAATHAIGFTLGGTVASPLTLRNIAFSGYHATNGNNDSALLFPDTGADVTWTVNLVGCTGDISYKKSRATDTVVLVVDPVTLTFQPLVANTEVRVYEAGTTTEVAGVENSGTSFDYVYTSPTGFNVDIVIHRVGYIYIRNEDFELPTGDASFPVTQRPDPNDNNP